MLRPLTLAVLLLAACEPAAPPPPPAPPAAIVTTGHVASIDGHRIREGAALVTVARPIVVLGQYHAPNEPVEVTWVVLVRHGRGDPRDGAEVTGSAHMTAERSGGTATVSLGEAAVHIEHERAGTETLTVNGEPIDLDVGRVILVDLTSDPPRTHTVDSDLHPGGPWPADTAGMERLARHLLDDLANRYELVRAFVITGGT